MELKIKEEFKKLIPPLTAEEFKQLETNCIDEGIRDAIVTWQGFIIDGHNRYKIATDWQLTFKTIEKNFDSEYHVIEWMLVNQFGRRNLTETQKSYLRGVRQRNEVILSGTRTDLVQHLHKVDTNKRLAEEYNVSKRTIINDGHFSRGLDLISKVAPEKHDEILSEKTDFTKQVVIEQFSKIEKEVEKEVKSQEIFISESELKEKIEAKAKEMAEVKLKELEEQKKAIKEAKFIELQHKKEQYIESFKSEIKNIPEIFNTDAVSFLNTFNDNSIDLLVTDPPYATDIDNIEEFTKEWLSIALNKVKKSGRIYICAGAYPNEIKAFLDVLLNQNKFIIDNPLIWTYRNTLGITPKMKYNLNYQMIWHLYSNESKELDTSITNEMFSVQDINAPDGRIGNRLHTWQKPDELAHRLIRHSSKENDLVVDCFCCTGTFLIAASKLNRIAKGCDINIDNLLIAKNRGCTINGQQI